MTKFTFLCIAAAGIFTLSNCTEVERDHDHDRGRHHDRNYPASTTTTTTEETTLRRPMSNTVETQTTRTFQQ